MIDTGKRLSRPTAEDKRAAALRENLKKRKIQAAGRQDGKKDDAKRPD